MSMIGKTLGHYSVSALLGKGGMGEVYKAKDQKLGRDVAIKVLPEEFAKDFDRVARFQREAKLLASLNHPNIAAIHGLEKSHEKNFLVMELIEGETLANRIQAGPISVDESLKLALQIAEAIEAGHDKGVIHRDLKPANVMVTPKGLVKVLDYGLAKLISSSSMNLEETTKTYTEITEEGKVLGTVAYMSPEQVAGKKLDVRSDFFSFGLVFYEMLAGRPAFCRDSRISTLSAILQESPVSVRKIQPKVPSNIQRILERCLEKDRERRYGSAGELRRALTACREQLVVFEMKSQAHLRRKRFLVPAAVLLLALICVVAWLWIRSSRVNWALNVAIPQIELLADKSDYATAYNLAKKAQKYIPRNAQLTELLSSVSIPIAVETNVPDAGIQFREYAAPDGAWQELGQSPLNDVVVSRGLKRWRISKQGYRTMEAAWSPGVDGLTLKFALDEESEIPDGMVRVPGAPGGVFMFLTGLDHIEAPGVNDYLIDSYEITNKQYAEFVAAGGYRQPKFWNHRFVKNGEKLSWQEAMDEFRDSTGQPGPATWELGSYIKGQENVPVAGVSWYEAAAYTEFAGKSLPSIYHWNRAAFTRAGFLNISPVVRLSNFAGQGLARGGQFTGVNPYGTYDMAGNVKEWCWNAMDVGGERRYILGGAWNEPEYMFNEPEAQPPMSRSATFGFRCVKYLTDIPPQLLDAVDLARREYAKEMPVADDVFRIYQSFYSYDKTDLDPVVESVDDTSEYWRIEKVTLNAAYGGERLILYLFIPRGVEPPYQAVMYFPPSSALLTRSFKDSQPLNYLFDFIVRRGRAIAYPVYKSTYERGDGMLRVRPNLSSRFRDHVIQWYKDFARSVDYLEERKDFDARKLGYYGWSWGAAMGPIVLAQDTRIKAAVLALGGFWQQKSLPEVDQINFAPRVKMPVLLLNGKFDFIFPVETSQAPMFRLMQAPEQDKRHLLFDSGHTVLMKDLIIETLQWFDQYLGPAK